MHTTSTTGNKNSKSKTGPIACLVFGLQVLLAEAKWLLLNAIRTFEISRLKKRRHAEHALLGSLLASSAGNAAPDDLDALPCTNPEAKIALKQILFMNQEIAYLQSDRENMRQEFYERRKKKLGIA